MKKFFFFASAMMVALTINAQTIVTDDANHINNTPVSNLDLNRYLGSWYEIARFDHSFERGIDNCTAFYSMNEDGTICVSNTGWKDEAKKNSIGKTKITDTPGVLRVSFFGPFYGDYRVLMIDETYSVALIGGSNDKYLWILSRTPEILFVTQQAILQEAQQRGYDTSKLIWVNQSRSLK